MTLRERKRDSNNCVLDEKEFEKKKSEATMTTKTTTYRYGDRQSKKREEKKNYCAAWRVRTWVIRRAPYSFAAAVDALPTGQLIVRS